MMFIVRSSGKPPSTASVAVKVKRKTPDRVPGSSGKIDYFCVANAQAIGALRAEGWDVVELRDGWYADDKDGGIAIFGQGKYWEMRDSPFTVKEAVGPAVETDRQDGSSAEHVNVRRAVFGV